MGSSTGFVDRLTSQAGIVARDNFSRMMGVAQSYPYAIPDPSYGLAKDQNIYELVRHEPYIASIINTRKLLVAGGEWQCVPGEEDPEEQDIEAAKVATEALRGISRFSSSRLNLAEADFRGSAYAKILGMFAWRDWGDGKMRRWWVPTRLADVNRLRVRWRKPNVHKGEDRPVLQMSRVLPSATPGVTGVGQFEDVEHPEWLVQHVFDDQEDTLGYGRGLVDAMYHYYYAIAVVNIEMLGGVEAWARGKTTIEVDGDRAGGTAETNQALVDAAVTRVERSMSRHVLAVMKGDLVKWQGGGGEGHQLCRSALEFLIQGVSRLVLGSVLPFGGGQDVGSNARAHVERDTTDSVVGFSRGLMEETVGEQVLGLFWKLNRANLLDCGLGTVQVPKFQFTGDDRSTPTEAAEVIKAAVDAGLDVSKKQAYKLLGLRQPRPDEDVIKGGSTKPLDPFGAAPFGDGSQPPGDGKERGPVEDTHDEEPDDEAVMNNALEPMRLVREVA